MSSQSLKVSRLTRSSMTGVALAVAVWLATAVGLDLIGGRPPPPGPWDAVVVAGAGVMPGGVPSDALWARTRRGVDLWHAGAAPVLALTGGVGDWGPAEAVVAEQLALGWGVPASAIVSETRSTSTETNAAELAPVLVGARVLVVTDRYHVMRCERVFRRHFPVAEAVGVRSPPWIRARGALREVAAVALYAVTGRL